MRNGDFTCIYVSQLQNSYSTRKKKKSEFWFRTGSSHVGHWASQNALFPNISLKMDCKWYVWLFLDKSELADAKIHIIKLHIETLVSLFLCVYTQNVYVLNILCCNFDESIKKPYKSKEHQKWTRFHEAKWLNFLSIIWDSTSGFLNYCYYGVCK